MTEALTFSVVTPSYNQVAFIERTIRSVLTQDVQPLEYVVMDGGSSDGTVEILDRYADRLWYRSEPDDGQADAVNKGIRQTAGELIGWLNSDDIYYPDTLRTVRSYFAAHPEVDVVYGDADHIDEQDRVLEPYGCEPWDPERLHDICFLCQPAVFFRRRVVERHGLLDANLDYCMDYEYWLRLATQGARFAHLRRKLAGSRMYAWNKTLGQRIKVHAEINGMLRRRLGSVPTRWLSNYAHVVLEENGFRRERGRVRFAAAVSVATWLAALRWNHRVSPQLRQLTRGWVSDAIRTWRQRPTPAPRSVPPHRDGGARGSRLRVGFDVSQTGTRRAGCGQLSLELARALEDSARTRGAKHEYLLYPTFGDAFWDPEGPEATWRGSGSQFQRWPGHTSLAAAREFWRSSASNLDNALGNPDVVHSHNFFCPVGLQRARLVYTLYDLSFLVHPEWTTEANRHICFTGVFNASLHADFVIAISNASRSHFLQVFPHYPVERTAVVYPASRFTDRRPVPRSRACSGLTSGRFFLSVGTLEPRKNLARVVTAYAGYLGRTKEPMPLVLAGGAGWLMDGFDQQIRELGLTRRVVRLGYVDDRTLQWLYQNCHSFLYPSLFEGFGLPVVEALSQEAAVVTSRVTSLPEVAGEAALYVDATDTADIEEALVRIASDEELRTRLRHRAAAQATKFSWHEAAERVLACYDEVVKTERLAREFAVSG
jgi:glycosyltransferase involved in cell wall biosynthesis